MTNPLAAAVGLIVSPHLVNQKMTNTVYTSKSEVFQKDRGGLCFSVVQKCERKGEINLTSFLFTLLLMHDDKNN